MRRHENLKLAIISWVVTVIFMVLGFWLQFSVCRPILNTEDVLELSDMEVYFYTFIPLAFIAFMALFAILGLYFFYCEYQIEHGQYIEAKITNVKEGKRSTVFCEWTNNDNKSYYYKIAGIENNKAAGFKDKGRITLRISKGDPRLHYFVID